MGVASSEGIKEMNKIIVKKEIDSCLDCSNIYVKYKYNAKTSANCYIPFCNLSKQKLDKNRLIPDWCQLLGGKNEK